MNRFLQYVGAIVFVGLAIYARLLLDPWLGTRFPYSTVFLAVLLAAWIGGFRTAFIACVFGGIAGHYFLVEPRGQFGYATSADVVGAALYYIISLSVAGLGGSMHRAQAREHAATAQALAAAAKAQASAEAHTTEASRLRGTVDLALLTSRQIMADRDLSEIMHSIVDGSRKIVDADFGAMGIGCDPTKPFDPWVFSGVSKDLAAMMGHSPRPIGLLGLKSPFNIENMDRHPVSVGFPQNHPAMGAVLGVPIYAENKVLGTLYLSKHPDKPPFSVEDVDVIQVFANQVALALDNSKHVSEAQNATRMRDELMAMVSHDLKNPITSMSLEPVMEGSA